MIEDPVETAVDVRDAGGKIKVRTRRQSRRGQRRSRQRTLKRLLLWGLAFCGIVAVGLVIDMFITESQAFGTKASAR